MPDPEIDRRCSTCGAAVRPRSLFCPQCGEAIANQPNQPESPSSELLVEKVTPPDNLTVEIARESIPDFSKTQPLSSVADSSLTMPLTPVVSDQPSTAKHPNLQRASNVARDLEQNVKGRVEKLRKASSVVIDQAAYDPSLRFILVAAGLFLLFLFLLIVSKVLG